MSAPRLNVNTACRWSLVVIICILVVATGVYIQYIHRIAWNLGYISGDGSRYSPHETFITKLPKAKRQFSEMVSGEGEIYTNHNNMLESTPNQIGPISETKDLSADLLKTKERLDARMAQVLKACQNSNYSQLKEGPNVERIIAFGRLSFCPIAKCGTTFIRRDLTPKMRIRNEDAPFSPSQRKTFFLVREPYGRLVSTFFSKIVGLPYWWNYSSYIVRKFRPNASDMSVRCGYDTTFSEYIKFVISGRNRDPHFLRIMEVCNICKDIPDFVATLETIKDDLKYILNSVDVEAMTGKSFNEVKILARNFMHYYVERNVTNCGSMCTSLNRYWYGQQATGLIDFGIELPVKGEDCENINGKKLAELAWDAHLKSVGRINKREVKERVQRELYQQVALEDREELARLLAIECEIFGYDSRPDFVFPKS